MPLSNKFDDEQVHGSKYDRNKGPMASPDTNAAVYQAADNHSDGDQEAQMYRITNKGGTNCECHSHMKLWCNLANVQPNIQYFQFDYILIWKTFKM